MTGLPDGAVPEAAVARGSEELPAQPATNCRSDSRPRIESIDEAVQRLVRTAPPLSAAVQEELSRLMRRVP